MEAAPSVYKILASKPVGMRPIQKLSLNSNIELEGMKKLVAVLVMRSRRYLFSCNHDATMSHMSLYFRCGAFMCYLLNKRISLQGRERRRHD